MTQLPEQTFAALKLLFDLLGANKEEADIEMELFEYGLQLRVIERLAKKLAEKDKKELVELANKVGEKKAETSELEKKLKKLFTEKEIAEVFKKAGDEFFEEVLKEEYGKADVDQKKKLEEMFKKEVLKE